MSTAPTINAMKSAFLPYRQRCDFIYTVIKPINAKICEALIGRGRTQACADVGRERTQKLSS